MKRYLIALLIDYIMDALILALTRLSKQSDNQVDDELVKTITENRDIIAGMIKGKI